MEAEKTKAAGEVPKLAGKAARPKTNGLELLVRAAIGLWSDAISAKGVTRKTRFNSPRELFCGLGYPVGPRSENFLQILMDKANTNGTVSVENTVEAVETAYDVDVERAKTPQDQYDNAFYAVPSRDVDEELDIQDVLMNAVRHAVALDLKYVADPEQPDKVVLDYLEDWLSHVPFTEALQGLQTFIKRGSDIPLEDRHYLRENLGENKAICEDPSVAHWFPKE